MDDPDESIDKEDSERENEMNLHEKAYNFRFEDPNAANITTYARDVPEEALRRKDSTRIQARERAKLRKEEDKEQKKAQLNQLKQIKKEEILSKIKKAEQIAGVSLDNPAVL
jgi:protein KRI1